MAKIDGNKLEIMLKITYCLLRSLDKDIRISKKTLLNLPSDWAENLVLIETVDGSCTLLAKKTEKQGGIITKENKIFIPPVSLN